MSPSTCPAGLSICIALMVLGAFVVANGCARRAEAKDVVLVPDGGRLDALDEQGQLIGPCPLKHTDVDVHISGHITRVNVTQRYHNPYDHKIEAVYTFPLSHRGAVDRMTMTIGDRVVEGEVKQREVARQIYEAARSQGHVTSLLEQERPNIFTQSVANIEPGAEVLIEISYVEVLQSVDGSYQFDFPMVVAPRYTPGTPLSPGHELPEGVVPRRGVVLPGPAEIEAGSRAAGLSDAWLRQHATTIQADSPIVDVPRRQSERPRLAFTAKFADGQVEQGAIFDDGIGHVGGRWFFCPPRVLPRPGEPFAVDTDQVLDASRVTPMPVRPDQRAGHDIAVQVTIDTGGPGIVKLESPSHDIVRSDQPATRDDGLPDHTTVSLETGSDIPNRDFRLAWRLSTPEIEEAILTHTGDYGDFEGGFFTLILQPPERIPDDQVRPRELIFVLDQSGSMTGARLADRSALDAAKDVIRQAIDTMRPNDRFNIISFQSTLDVLWDEAKPNTAENRARAQRYIDERQGGGGTEMRNAVLKALGAEPFAREQQADRTLSLMELANLPADGREVTVRTSTARIARASQHRGPEGCWREYTFRANDEVTIDVRDDVTEVASLPEHRDERDVETSNLVEVLLPHLLTGRWETVDGRRLFVVTRAGQAEDDHQLMRIVLFVTDGLVSNDAAIIEAIRKHAHQTRVFTIGMSHSPNRHLLDEMARAGRGAADYVLPEDDVSPIVQRFADRIATPVLTDIELSFDGDFKITDLLPSPAHMPDLFDVQPLVIHGRYTQPGQGSLTIRGRTGEGRYERKIDLELPEAEPKHDVIATVWAREKVGELMREGVGELMSDEDKIKEIVDLGESFQIVTHHTSFVAVERQRVTIDGEPVLVRVPIEFPKGMSWEGIFGPDVPDQQLLRRPGMAPTQQFRPQREALPEDAALGIRAAPAGPPVRLGGRRLQEGYGTGLLPASGEAAAHRPASDVVPLSDSAEAGMDGIGAGFGYAGGAIGGAFAYDLERRGRGVGYGRELARMPVVQGLHLPQGLRLDTVILSQADQGDVAKRLGSLLGSTAEQEPDQPAAIGRVIQLDRSGDLHVVALAPVAEFLTPFAEKLADQNLPDRARRSTLEEMIQALGRELPTIRRDLELRRKLEKSLYDQAAAIRAGEQIHDAPGGKPLRVTVLLGDLEEETIRTLDQAGFQREATADIGSFVIGRLAPDRLETVAMLPVVRRVEPLE